MDVEWPQHQIVESEIILKTGFFFRFKNYGDPMNVVSCHVIKLNQIKLSQIKLSQIKLGKDLEHFSLP